MFEVAFSELLLILTVALVVIGPERLPRLVRTAGLLLGKAKRQMGQLKHEIERDLRLQELQGMNADLQQRAGDLESELRDQVREVEAQWAPQSTAPDETSAKAG